MATKEQKLKRLQQLKDKGITMTPKELLQWEQQQDLIDAQKKNLKGISQIKGEKGNKGDKGDQGERGYTGPQGKQGPQGKTGAKGPKGDKGERGRDGIDGLDGLDGQDAILPDLNSLSISTINVLETLRGEERLSPDFIRTEDIRLDASQVSNLPQSVTHHSISNGGGSYGVNISASGVNKRQGASKIDFGSGLTVTPTPNGVSVTSAGGGGTVTDVSVVTANGLSGTVATSTTTPAITLDISALDATKIADGTVTSAEFQYLGGVTSDIQTQLDAKGTGDVTKVGTPVDNQVGVWTGDGTIEGDSNFTWDGSDLLIGSEFKYDSVNSRLSVGTTDQTVAIDGATALGINIGSETSGVTDLVDFFAHRHSSTAGFGTHMLTARSRGTHASPTVVQDGDKLSIIAALGHDGSEWELATSIDSEVDGTPGANDMPGRIVFKTTPDGSATPVERMRIDSAGNVNIAGLTASEIVITDASKNLVSAPVSTYPSLTELTYVKGVTSAIQTQIDGITPATPGGADGDLQINASGAFGTVDGLNLDQTGNARGTGSLDIQATRTAVTEVANGDCATALGNSNTASGNFTTASGYGNIASALNSNTMGRSNFSSTGGVASVNVGLLNNSTGGTLTPSTGVITGTPVACTTVGYSSVAMGICNRGTGCSSVAVGTANTASGGYSAALGYASTASGRVSISMGYLNCAVGSCAVSIGYTTKATTGFSTAIGFCASTSSGNYAQALGYCSCATGQSSQVVGNRSCATATGATAMGYYACAIAGCATAIGTGQHADALASTSVGHNGTASGCYASSFGSQNIASALNSNTVGRYNFSGAGGLASVNTGILNNSQGGAISTTTGVITGTPIAYAGGIGALSVAYGVCNRTQGAGGTAIGSFSQATGACSSAFGNASCATTAESSAFGRSNVASGNASAAFGRANTASGNYSAAIGNLSSATADYATSIGRRNVASGTCSSAIGFCNTASATGAGAIGVNITNSTANSVEVGPSNTEKIRVDTNGLNVITAAGNVSLNGTALLQNIVEDTTPQLGGELDAGAHSIGFTMQTATGDGTTTIDWKLGNHMDFTFGAFNETFTFTAPTKAGVYTMSLKQDSVGSRTATFPATVKWVAGAAPTLTTTATTGYDIISFRFDGTNYYGVASLDFS